MIAYDICLSLTYFTEHNTLQVHPCCCKWQNFMGAHRKASRSRELPHPFSQSSLSWHYTSPTALQHNTTQGNAGEKLQLTEIQFSIHSKLRGQNRNQVEFWENVENYHSCTPEFAKLELYTSSGKCGFIKRTQENLMETKFRKYSWASWDYESQQAATVCCSDCPS